MSTASGTGYDLAVQYGATDSGAAAAAAALSADTNSYFSQATNYLHRYQTGTTVYTAATWLQESPERRQQLTARWASDAANTLLSANYSAPPATADVQYTMDDGATVDFATTFAGATSSVSADADIRKAYADAATRAVGSSYLMYTTDNGKTISTQDMAQRALSQINSAIVSKDQIRAKLGAVQNRLQNTVQNLAIQAENLQAAESRISDVDVSSEMTEFVRQQILTQAAVAMLAQANSLPKMAMQLIQG